MTFEPSAERVAEIIKERQKEKGRNILVAVGGPGGSGKTAFASHIAGLISDSNVIHTDDYRFPRKERSKNMLGSNPAANDINLLLSHFDLIKNNTPFDKPVYNTVTGKIDLTETYTPRVVNIVEGEISTIEKLLPHYDLKIYLDTSIVNQLLHRLKRDRNERKYSSIKSIYVFLKSNLVDYQKYNYKINDRADLIVKRIK